MKIDIKIANGCKNKDFKLEEGMIVEHKSSFSKTTYYFIGKYQIKAAFSPDENITENIVTPTSWRIDELEYHMKNFPKNYRIYKGKITIELTEEIKF